MTESDFTASTNNYAMTMNSKARLSPPKFKTRRE